VRRAIAVLAVIVFACGGQEPPAKPPPAPPPPADPPALASIAKACARVTACAHGDARRFRDPSACVEWWLGEPEHPLRKCLGEATNCEQTTACLRGGGDARAAAFCGQRQGVVSGCDGERLVSCGDDDSAFADCAAIGATCKEIPKAAGVTVRACISPQKCPAGAPDARCDGPGAVITCRDGAIERVVCRPGTTCQERPDSGEAACDTPRRCGVRGTKRCEDGRLVECDPSGPYSKAKVTDCAGLGLRCSGLGPRASCLVPTDVECDSAILPRCEGASLVFCAAGRLAKVPCSGIGLSTCDPSAKGPIAACK
jgi:hypothetical protein